MDFHCTIEQKTKNNLASISSAKIFLTWTIVKCPFVFIYQDTVRL